MFFYFANLIENNDIEKVIQVSKTIEFNLTTLLHQIKDWIDNVNTNLSPIFHAITKMIF